MQYHIDVVYRLTLDVRGLDTKHANQAEDPCEVLLMKRKQKEKVRYAKCKGFQSTDNSAAI